MQVQVEAQVEKRLGYRLCSVSGAAKRTAENARDAAGSIHPRGARGLLISGVPGVG